MELRMLSLFSGVGGMERGAENAGIQTIGQVELGEFQRKVLSKHWPEVPKWGEIQDVGERELSSIYPIDVVAGGFPCQDISNAGKRAGISGTRSGLWSEMVRTIRLVRPKYAVVENVAALLVRGMETVLGDLAESGYDAEWDCLPAVAFGASHRRDRTFIVAYPEREGLEREGISNVFPTYHAWKPVQFRGLSESDIVRRRNDVPNYMDRIVSMGNAVVPPVAAWVFKQVVEHERTKGGTPDERT